MNLSQFLAAVPLVQKCRCCRDCYRHNISSFIIASSGLAKCLSDSNAFWNAFGIFRILLSGLSKIFSRNSPRIPPVIPLGIVQKIHKSTTNLQQFLQKLCKNCSWNSARETSQNYWRISGLSFEHF